MNWLWKFANKIFIKGGAIMRPLARLFEMMNYFFYSNSISAKSKIGRGTKFWHRGMGCVVHPKCVIGDNCNIFQNVTLGSKWSNNICDGGAPRIGDNCMIGAGAVLLGNITVGNNVVIGANAVVTKDIPDNSIVVGVPGKIISTRKITNE